MKKTTFIATAMAGVMLISCGVSSRKEKAIALVKPEKTEISGVLSDYIEVVDGEYEVVEDWGGQLSIKVKAKQAAPEKILENKRIELKISLLKENGMPVSGTEEFEIDYQSRDKLEILLQTSDGEEIVSFKSMLGGYYAKDHADKVKKFTVSSFLKEKVEPSTPSPEVEDSKEISSASSSGSAEWDSLLDDYEEMYDDYIKLVKKAQKNDNSALSEYPKVYAKMITVGQKLEKAGNDLSPEQMTRFMEIQVNAMQAATKLSK